jgi:hypothetical protein
MEAFWPSLLAPCSGLALSCDLGLLYKLRVSYLSSKVGSTTLRDLEDDGAVLVASSLKASNDSGGRGDVLYSAISISSLCTGTSCASCNGQSTYNGGNSIAVLLGVLEETEDVITDDDAGLAGKLLKDTHCDYG